MVYKGQLSVDGRSTPVAVKRLNEQFGQGLKEFLIEIQLLTGQNHPNLISLLGYCDEGNEKIIVYEFAEHGSLDQYLRRNNTIYGLTWLERLKICVNAARGLNQLHNHVGEHQTIIHRDIKSSNILLDHNWVAKISDLGLSKLSLSGLDRSAVVSHACGTRGYCEPEYFSTGIVKKESDVYSFGVVLYEVFCGKLCLVDDGMGFLLSGPLAKEYYIKKKVSEIVDPGVREQMSLESMNKFATIAYYCLHDDRRERPTMDLVTKELEELFQIQLSFCALKSPRETSFSHEASYGSSDVKVQGFDQTLQARADNVISNLDSDVISNLDSGLEDRAMSFFAEMYRNEKLALYKSKTSVVNNLKLANLVKDYQDINNQALGLSNSLRTCLKRLQETHHSILECVRHVHYEKTLVHLKSLKAAGDPFTQDFFKIFNFVYRRKIAFLEKLQRKKVKLCKKLDQTWFTKRVNSVLKAYKNKETEGHKEAIVFMQVVSYRGIRDMGKIQFLVNKLQMDVENFMRNAEFATKMKDAVKYVTDNMTEKLNSFLKNADALEDMSNVYTVDVQKAKTVTRITNPPASDS
ncbi:hypothetical protein R6Q59_018319 [Mikania micrantha]